MSKNAEKIYKKTLREQQKRLKPGECEKYVRLVLDETLAQSVLGQLLLLELTTLKIKTRGLGSNCLYWERCVGQREFISNDDLAAHLNDEWQMEDQVMQLLTKSELEYHIKRKTLCTFCQQLKMDFPGKRLTLLIPQMKRKNHELAADEIGRSLVDVQILEDVSVTQFEENAKELAELLKQFTKAIAEIPFKQQKYQNIGNFKKYLVNDKKNCVRVVGNIGFGQLWQQHLNRLPNVTLNIAETIKDKYNCPKKLIDDYEKNPNAVNEIADLKLNRSGAPQPLQTERRIGNVLSQKLFTLYNTRDPNACI